MASGEIKVVMEFPGLDELQRTLDELLEEPTMVERLEQQGLLDRLDKGMRTAHRRLQTLELRMEQLPTDELLLFPPGSTVEVQKEVRRCRSDMASMIGRMNALERRVEVSLNQMHGTVGRINRAVDNQATNNHATREQVEKNNTDIERLLGMIQEQAAELGRWRSGAADLREKQEHLRMQLNQVARTGVQARAAAVGHADAIDARYAKLFDELQKRVDNLVKERGVTREKREAELDKLRQHVRRLTLYHNQHLHEKPKSQAYTFAPTCTVSEDV